jgi:hypothetical protein
VVKEAEPKTIPTEEELLKELKKYHSLALIVVREAFRTANEGEFKIADYKPHEYEFTKKVKEKNGSLKEMVELSVELKSLIESVNIKLDEKAPDLVRYNEALRMLNEEICKHTGWWSGSPSTIESVDGERLYCRKWSYNGTADCRVTMSRNMYELLNQKLKENPKFLDDRISKK